MKKRAYQPTNVVVLEWLRSRFKKLVKHAAGGAGGGGRGGGASSSSAAEFNTGGNAHDEDDRAAANHHRAFMLATLVRVLVEPPTRGNANDDAAAAELLEVFGYDEHVIAVIQELLARRTEVAAAVRERIARVREETDASDARARSTQRAHQQQQGVLHGSRVAIGASSDKEIEKMMRCDMIDVHRIFPTFCVDR